MDDFDLFQFNNYPEKSLVIQLRTSNRIIYFREDGSKEELKFSELNNGRFPYLIGIDRREGNVFWNLQKFINSKETFKEHTKMSDPAIKYRPLNVSFLKIEGGISIVISNSIEGSVKATKLSLQNELDFASGIFCLFKSLKELKSFN